MAEAHLLFKLGNFTDCIFYASSISPIDEKKEEEEDDCVTQGSSSAYCNKNIHIQTWNKTSILALSLSVLIFTASLHDLGSVTTVCNLVTLTDWSNPEHNIIARTFIRIWFITTASCWVVTFVGNVSKTIKNFLKLEFGANFGQIHCFWALIYVLC